MEAPLCCVSAPILTNYWLSQQYQSHPECNSREAGEAINGKADMTLRTVTCDICSRVKNDPRLQILSKWKISKSHTYITCEMIPWSCRRNKFDKEGKRQHLRMCNLFSLSHSISTSSAAATKCGVRSGILWRRSVCSSQLQNNKHIYDDDNDVGFLSE